MFGCMALRIRSYYTCLDVWPCKSGFAVFLLRDLIKHVLQHATCYNITVIGVAVVVVSPEHHFVVAGLVVTGDVG